MREQEVSVDAEYLQANHKLESYALQEPNFWSECHNECKEHQECFLSN